MLLGRCRDGQISPPVLTIERAQLVELWASLRADLMRSCVPDGREMVQRAGTAGGCEQTGAQHP